VTTETMDVSEEIASFLQGRFPALAGRRLDAGTPLLASGAIDSLGILELVTFLDERFGVQMMDDDFDPANFETLGQLVAFVERQRA
jgi:acyl carrier protein